MSITNIVANLKDIKENIQGLDEDVRRSLGIEPEHVDEFIQRFEGHAEREASAAEQEAVKAFAAKWFAAGCPAVTSPEEKALLARYMSNN